MTRGNNWKAILEVIVSHIIISLSAQGAIAPCSAPLENIALYEGELNTLIYYPATPNGVKWSILATTDELTEAQIVNYNDQVDASYVADYAFGPSGLTIKNATTSADFNQHQLSTAGLYSVECGGNRTSFKVLVVVRQGASCSSALLSNKSNVEISCSSVYADRTYNPIAAIFTLYVDGNPIASDTPQRTNYDAHTWISSSAFTTNYDASSTYECVQTFGEPTEISDQSVVRNRPTFNHTCSFPALASKSTTLTQSSNSTAELDSTTPITSTTISLTTGYCSFPNIRNLVVREGTLDVPMVVSSNICSAKWTINPTSDESAVYPVIGSDCSVDSLVRELYHVNGTGLFIRNATITENGHIISTSGQYIAECKNDGSTTGAQLVVLRSGPECACIPDMSSNVVQLSCTVVVVKRATTPIPAFMTWTVNGTFYRSEEPLMSKTDDYVFTATSTIAVDGSTLKNYQCVLTFGKPRSIHFNTLITNAPEFNESCSTSVCGAKTATPAYESTADTKSSAILTTVTERSTKITSYASTTATTTKPDSLFPVTTSESITATTFSKPPSLSESGGLSQGGKIGIGVGIGVGGALVLCVVLVAVLYKRHQWNKRTIADDKWTSEGYGMEPEDTVLKRRHRDNSSVL